MAILGAKNILLREKHGQRTRILGVVRTENV